MERDMGKDSTPSQEAGVGKDSELAKDKLIHFKCGKLVSEAVEGCLDFIFSAMQSH
jgi:hypothetical protein